jgi:hypothetical protein
MAVRWEDLLMVGNCRQHWKDFAQLQTYICPATVDSFDAKHKQFRARYFAPFVSREIRYVAQIDAVVKVTSKTDAEVLWNNSEADEASLIQQARAKLEESNAARPPCLVYLLSNLKGTEFVFDGQGTLSGSRQYFNVSDLNASNVGELAEKLRSVVWSALPKYSGER